MARNGTEKSTLTPKQQRLVVALLSGQTDEMAAMQCGISRRTVARWKKLPGLQAEMDRVARETYKVSVSMLSALCTEAVGVLRDTMADTVLATAGERIRAARIVLETCMHHHAPRGDESLDAIPVAKFLGGDVMDDFDIERESA